jgi:hypothetical protein
MGKQSQIGDALVAPIKSKGFDGKLKVVGCDEQGAGKLRDGSEKCRDTRRS